MKSRLQRALVSGSVAAAAVTLVASLAGRRATGSYAAPLNATSHFLWGGRAGRRNDYSLKYTASGFIANYGAAVFWALLSSTTTWCPSGLPRDSRCACSGRRWRPSTPRSPSG